MRKLFVVLSILPLSILADESALRVLQSGSPEGAMALHERGVNGAGEIVAIADTGVDVDHCAFAEADKSLPPVNVRRADGTLQHDNIDLSRRKIVAYNFLSNDDPADPRDWDNLGHGTFIAGVVAGDTFPFGTSGNGEGIAPAAKLIIQDFGFVQAPCSLPGLGCPPTDIRPVLEQARLQGATVISHQWGDQMGRYATMARQVDDWIDQHPEMVVVFIAGNAGAHGPSSVASPGLAKNAIQVGGTRAIDFDDSKIWEASGRGPALDGRLKPDLVAPSTLVAAISDGTVTSDNCTGDLGAGTSYAGPLVAGAASLVRQYYRDGFYPTGAPLEANRLTPSAALVKATLIASARQVPFVNTASGPAPALPVPSVEQGFGLPALDDALHFAGDGRPVFVLDRPAASGLRMGETAEIAIAPSGGRLVVSLVWTDPPTPAGAPQPLVHDLDLELIAPDGLVHQGNASLTGGSPDRLNNVEVVAIENPAEGTWRLRVRGERVGSGGRQAFAIVAAGATSKEPEPRRRLVRRGR
ncbi:MAG: S8 family serine peptidase [Thermoanaerobaculia bacterium]